MPYVYEDKAGHLLEKYLSSELKTVSSFYIKFKVCVCGFFFSV